MTETKSQPSIKDQIRDALKQSAEKAHAEILSQQAQEDERWVAEQSQRVLAMCQDFESGETLELVFLEHNPPDDTEKRRLTLLSQRIGIDLDKLPIKSSFYREESGMSPFSIQGDLEDLLRLVGH